MLVVLLGAPMLPRLRTLLTIRVVADVDNAIDSFRMGRKYTPPQDLLVESRRMKSILREAPEVPVNDPHLYRDQRFRPSADGRSSANRSKALRSERAYGWRAAATR